MNNNIKSETFYRLLDNVKNKTPFINTIKNLENLSSYYSLKNKDFRKGTYRIRKPGIYILTENIVFHPNPDNDCLPTKDQEDEYPTSPGSPFTLGFFAAITIETHGVIIDLNGFEIRQSHEHYVHQRFFACIELASSPFFTNQGPASFTSEKNKFKGGCDILITNGKLGLSSHHGIHSNNSSNVIIDNLTVHNFEICGIALNGSINTIINNVTIKDNLQTVPLSAKYSQARFLRRHLKKINKITLNNLVSKKLLNEIENTINIAKRETIKFLKFNTPINSIPELFRNSQLLSDGAVYGLLLHQNGVAIGPFLKERNPEKGNTNIILENITIKNIHSKPQEIVGLSRESNNPKKYSGKVMTGPAGDVFDILFNTDIHCNYNKNILADAQIFIAKNDLINNTNTGTTSISKKIIDWVEGKISLISAIQSENPTCFVFGGDSMAHAMKGNIGLFISGGKDFYLNNICVNNIKNWSKDIGKLPDKVKIIYEKITNLKSRVPNGLSDLGGKEYNTLLTASENINFSKHKGGSTIINSPTLS